MKRQKKVKKIFSILRLTIFLLVISGVVFWGAGRTKDLIIERFFTTPQGTITVISLDDKNDLPIKGVEFNIIKSESGEVLEALVTDVYGVATSSPLDYGVVYDINQVSVPFPYELGNGTDLLLSVELNEENHEVTTNNNLLEHIKGIERTENGDITIKEVFIPVPIVMQNPELPNGCEITSLTSVLNYYGYNVSKTVMSDSYLRKREFLRRDGKLFGADPYIAFSGDPRSASGFYVYAPPIVEAADNYLKDVGVNHKTKDISGSTIEEILDYVSQGRPVVIWTSIDQMPIRFGYKWHLFESGEVFDAALNLHAVVLNGYLGDKVHVMDPQKGHVSYDSKTFFEGYFSLDSQAMIVY